jgi:large repetitive protein
VTAGTGLLSSAAGASGSASGTIAHGGTVTVNGDGSFSYTPARFTGSDSFTYTVSVSALT